MPSMRAFSHVLIRTTTSTQRRLSAMRLSPSRAMSYHTHDFKNTAQSTIEVLSVHTSNPQLELSSDVERQALPFVDTRLRPGRLLGGRLRCPRQPQTGTH